MRAAVAGCGDVAEVGDVGVEAVAVVGGQRQRPHPLARRVGRAPATWSSQAVVVAHQPGDPVAEGDLDRAGERGQVDDGVGLGLAGQRQARRPG